MDTQNTVSPVLWSPGLLRLTAFVPPTAVVSTQGWWKQLTDAEPDEVTDQPRAGLHLEVGLLKDFEDAELRLQIQAQKVDWILSVETSPLVPVTRYPVLGQFDEKIDFFKGLLGKWLGYEARPEIIRFALGCELYIALDDPNEGYDMLNKYTRLNLNTQNASEFIYQINRRRPTKTGIAELNINRLSRWSVSQFTQRIFSENEPQNVRRHFACRLDLDINTVPEFHEVLSTNQLVGLLDEFIALGREIAVHGDIP